MKKLIMAVLLLLVFTSPVLAAVNVVATLPWIGSIAKEIGKDKVNITVLVKPNQDPHYVEAKPSMIRSASRAEAIMYNGLDLETGYLSLIIRQARNPGIQPGQKGNLDCSRFIDPIDKARGDIDRSMGDVHPLGNPHYHFSPTNVLKVAEGMAGALAELDQTNADFYRANFKTFAGKLEEKRKHWRSLPLGGKRFIAHHRLFEYMAVDFGFQIAGYVEPKPGIPPSAAHIERLIEDMRNSRPDGILTTGVFGMKEAGALAEKTGVRVIVVPNDVGAMPGTDDWLSFMDKAVTSLK